MHGLSFPSLAATLFGFGLPNFAGALLPAFVLPAIALGALPVIFIFALAGAPLTAILPPFTGGTSLLGAAMAGEPRV